MAKTNDLIHIGEADISIKEYNGQRVVTFKDIDAVHGRPDGTARKRFSENRKHFIEGEDYFIIKPQDLENTGMSEKRTSGIEEVNNRGTALITEQGYLMLVKSFTDDLAWDVQRQLVNGYFKVRKISNNELSPELQMLQGLLNQMVNKELEDKERDRKIAIAQETAQKAVETTNNIKEAVKPVLDNWRTEIKSRIAKIAPKAEMSYGILQAEMYKELERRAGVDLNRRVNNMKQRAKDSCSTKKQVDDIRKIDVIEQDKKLREIYSKIVTEYEIRYCA